MSRSVAREAMSIQLLPAGSCHCGAVQVDLTLSQEPQALRVRACRCDFCSHRGSRTISDPDGQAVVRAERREALIHYRFGLQTADYLLCAACGTYVAAVQWDDRPIGVVNVNGLGVPEFEEREPVPVDHSGETVEARHARRRGYWMPIRIAYSSTIVAEVGAMAAAGPL